MRKIVELLSQAKMHLSYLKNIGADNSLPNREIQRTAFLKLRKQFPSIYSRAKIGNFDEFVTPTWSEFNKKAEKALLPYPPFSFLKTYIVRYTMFSGKNSNYEDMLSFIKKQKNQDQIKKMLLEEPVGNPLIPNKEYTTSYGNVQTVYTLLLYKKITSKNAGDYKTIVEWGGGYGSLAKIIRKTNKKKRTYVIIDTPLFSCLQWLYLATIFSESEVNILTNKKDKIIEGKINLVPLSFIKNIDIKADLFISTWALSESSKYSQEYVLSKQMFDAKHLLIAFDLGNKDFADGGFRLKNLLKNKAKLIRMPASNSYYFIK